MKRTTILVLVLLILVSVRSYSQKPDLVLGVRAGYSVVAGSGSGQVFNYITGRWEDAGGSSSSSGFQFGPMGEVSFGAPYAVCVALNINTQSGTPIEWQNLFKYYIPAPYSQLKPYVDGGFSLYFVSGGTYAAIPFGGGVLIPYSSSISIPVDVQIGPIFATGRTIFGFMLTSGVRFSLN